MNCQKTQDKFADFLTGDLDVASREEVQNHISACGPCREELENLTAVWAKLGVLPEEQPSGRLRDRFYSMLEEAKGEIEAAEDTRSRAGSFSAWKAWFTFHRPSFAAAFSILLLFLGLGGGWILSGGKADAGRISSLEQEVRDMRLTAALSLLDQPSATERLQGISYSTDIEKPDDLILARLVNTLDTDPNPNVRLAAVEALYLFRKEAGVKDGLVRSLAVQDSPLVQMALIDLLVEVREARAAEALKSLIESEWTNPDVKKRAEEGLKLII
jgi:hypothetical protein